MESVAIARFVDCRKMVPGFFIYAFPGFSPEADLSSYAGGMSILSKPFVTLIYNTKHSQKNESYALHGGRGALPTGRPFNEVI